MPPDLALLSTLTGSKHPFLELIFLVPKVFKPLKFDRILSHSRDGKTLFYRQINAVFKKRNNSGYV